MPSRAPFVALVVLLVASAPMVAGGSSHFDVSVAPPPLDTPDRSVTFQGSTFELTELARVDQGEDVTAEVDGVGTNSYVVYLYNADKQIEQQRDDDLGPTFTFQTDSLGPGNYVVALSVDGSFEDIEPVVVSKYRISTSAPAAATEGATVEVEATLTEIESAKTLDRVQVVIGDGGEDIRKTLSHQSGTTYNASVDVSSLSTGTYSLYVVAQGTEDLFNGHQEVLGASDTQEFEITAQDTATDENEDGGESSGGSGGGGGGIVAPSTTTASTTTETTETTIPSPTTTSTEEPASTTATAAPTSASESSSDPDPSTTADESVITPNAPTTAPPETTTPGQPLGIVPPLVALLLVALALRRRP